MKKSMNKFLSLPKIKNEDEDYAIGLGGSCGFGSDGMRRAQRLYNG